MARAPFVSWLITLFAVAAPRLAPAQLFDSGDNNFYNPCNPPTSVVRVGTLFPLCHVASEGACKGEVDTLGCVMQGDSFVFGISYWPGYTVTNW